MRKALSHRGVVIILCVLVEWSSGGITTVICSGRVWVEPAPVFEMGLNVSILCQSALQNCQPRKFHLYKSSKGIQDKLRMAKLNQTTARLQLSDFREPRAHVICRVECPRQEGERLICGEDMASGLIPALPVITRAEDLNTSVSTTIIHWKIQTSMDGVFCEMRYKAATRPSWNVKELETTSTSMQHIQYNLEPSTKYAFQARCRQPGRRYRQEWSMPFFHTTPEAVPQVSLKSFQGEAHHVVPLSASIFKDHLTSGNRNPTAGLLSAMLFCVTVVSALFLTVIFKQSLRVRIKRRLLLLLPNWLHEDVPNVRNSCAIKTLQEISEFIMNNSSESSLDPDPVITEIEETYLQKEFQPIHSKMETTTEPAATGEDPHTSPLVDVTVAYLPDPSTGYKPQISSLLPGAHPTHKISDPRVSAFESQVNPLGLGKNVVIRNCPSPVFSSTSTNVGRDLFSLKERGLIFDPSESGSVEGPEETEMEALMTLEKQPSRESLPEQTLLPDDLVSCLRARGEEESPDVRPYFPQRFGGLFP
uniref:Interleukin-23 receptor isoform X2 n=1 Tax=Phascolarctos cinereus TaxID=38626 RepID=A0A6P5KV64_PHACI|nr:interleukin-23 receptor isoform X2 [Phascolarctos cinereus]